MIGVLVTAAILYVLYALVERFAVEPILPLDLFRNRVLAADSVLSLLQLMVLVGLIIYLPLFLQGVFGESATNAGAVITQLSVSVVLGAMLASFVVSMLKSALLVVHLCDR